MNVDIGSGQQPAPKPWVRVEPWLDEKNPPPDVLADGRALPFRTDSAERVYCGHVLEHVPWDDVQGFLGEVHRVLCLFGWVCVVGPDVGRMYQWSKDGLAGDDLWWGGGEGQSLNPAERFDTHKWSCTEGRVVDQLKAAGFWKVEAMSLNPFDKRLLDWPLPSRVAWQCAVIGRSQ